MNLDLWSRLGEWHQSVQDSVERLLPTSPTGGGANPETLGALRQRLLTAFEQLRASLLKDLSEREVNQFLLPLVLLSDEKIMGRLRAADRTLWPLLQRELYGLENGGDLFYELIDEQLELTAGGPWLAEVLLFCLSDGFRGRHGDSPSKVHGYQTKLANRLRQADPPPTQTKEEPDAVPVMTGVEPPSPTRRAVFYGGTAVILLIMPYLFVWLSNFVSVNG